MKKFLKVILIFLFLAFSGLVISLLTQSKGEWQCENGIWVKLGNPSSLPPEHGCFAVPSPKEPRPTSEKHQGIPLEGPWSVITDREPLLPAQLNSKPTATAPDF